MISKIVIPYAKIAKAILTNVTQYPELKNILLLFNNEVISSVLLFLHRLRTWLLVKNTQVSKFRLRKFLGFWEF